MKGMFKTSLLLYLRNKKNIFNIIFLIVSLLLVMGFSSYSLSAKNYIKYDSQNNPVYRKLDVSIETIDTNVEVNTKLQDKVKKIDFSKYGVEIDYDQVLRENGIDPEEYLKELNESSAQFKKYSLEELEEIRKNLENVEHVVYATNWPYYFNALTSETLAINDFNGMVSIYSANNKILPKIIKGTNFPDDDGDYMICPANFYPSTSTDFKKVKYENKINIDDYLNKTITFKYKSNMGKNNYTVDYKLVGFYENSSNELDENICYISFNSMKKIVTNMYSDDIDLENNVNNLIYQTGFVVWIDDKDNVDSVSEELSKLGYQPNLMYQVDPSGLNSLLREQTKNSALILFTTLFILVLILIKQGYDEKDQYKLLSFIGYKNNEIVKVKILNSLVQMFLSMIISIIFAIIISFFFKYIIDMYPFIINKWKLYINYFSILYVFITYVIAIIISLIIDLKNNKWSI